MLFGADATGAIGSAVNSSIGTLLPFPCEEPSEKELKDWIDGAKPMLRRAGYGPILRRETPPALLHLKGSDIVPPALTVEEETAAGAVESAKHERVRQQLLRTNTLRATQLRESKRNVRSQLHGMLETSMLGTARLRLNSLQSRHPETDVKGAVIPDTYDGVGMILELFALVGVVGLLDDPRDHDREVEKMRPLRDTALPDGYSAQDFSDKVTELVRDHVGHLERPLAGDGLGKFIIKRMPAINAAEGRSILRDMAAANTLGDQTLVLKQCMEIVRQSESPAAKAAAALVVQHRRAVMQLGPAAPRVKGNIRNW
jgi:hypothetical protein